MVLWNTVYIQKIVEELRAEGHHIRDEDIARISPLDFAHINFHGRYSFALPAEVTAGGAAPDTPADGGPHRALGTGILTGLGLCKAPSDLFVRHAGMPRDAAKAPAFAGRRPHRSDYRGVRHRAKTLMKRDGQTQPLRGGQTVEAITEPRDVSPQKTDPRILIHQLRMPIPHSGVKSCDTYTGFPFRSYPTPDTDGPAPGRGRADPVAPIASL